MAWPLQSPNLNIIECVLDYMKRQKNLRKPKSTDLQLVLQHVLNHAYSTLYKPHHVELFCCHVCVFLTTIYVSLRCVCVIRPVVQLPKTVSLRVIDEVPQPFSLCESSVSHVAISLILSVLRLLQGANLVPLFLPYVGHIRMVVQLSLVM
ncbi:hypothetical protein AMECASPLE_023663 [Ameca splendens]|uniref:Uncharacterized protein n=1 Tax=Ameca splendens TaxID=208324 RepID=A0ABV0YF94_9TELE